MSFKGVIFVYDTSKGYCRLVDREYSSEYKIVSHKIYKKIDPKIIDFDCKIAVLIVNEYDDYEMIKLLKDKAEIILLGVRPAIEISYLIFENKVIPFELHVKKKEFLQIVDDLLKKKLSAIY